MGCQAVRRRRHRVGAIGELEVAESLVGIPCPGGELVRALSAKEIVVAEAAEEPVEVGRATLADARVAPELVISAEAKDRVATPPAVQPIPGTGAGDDIVAGAAVDHAHPVVAPSRELGEVERHQCESAAVDRAGLGGLKETECVVAAEAADRELLDKRHTGRREPAGKGRLAVDDGDERLADGGILDRIVGVAAGRDQDVGGAVVHGVGRAAVAVVAVEDALPRRRKPGIHVEDQFVDAAAAVEFVGAALPLEPVAVGTAPDHVVAGVAIEPILARVAVERVGAAPGDVKVLRVTRADISVALDRVVAGVAVEPVGPNAAENPVVAAAAVHLLAAELRLAGHVGRERAERPAEELVDAVASEQPLADEPRVAALAVGGLEIAARIIHAAVAEERVGSGVAEELVNAEAAAEHVVVAAAAGHVVAEAAVDEVITRPTVEIVVALAAVDPVVGSAAEDPVGIFVAEEAVVAVVDEAFLGDAGESLRHQRLHAEGRLVPPGTRKVRRQLERDERQARNRVGQVREKRGHVHPCIGRHRDDAAPDGVIPCATVDLVVLGAADEEVVARTAEKRVGPRAALHGVVTVAGVDEVVAAEAGHGVISREGVDAVAPESGIDHVVADVAVDDVAMVFLIPRNIWFGGFGVAVDRVAVCRQASARRRNARVDDVAAFAAHDRVGAQTAEEHVVARAALDSVVPRKPENPVVAVLAKERVDAEVAHDEVITASADDAVLRRGITVGRASILGDAGIDRVVAGFAVDLVAAAARPHPVVAGTRVDEVDPRPGRDPVVAVPGVDDVVAAHAADHVGSAGPRGGLGRGHREARPGGEAVSVRSRDHVIAVDQVVARVGGDRVAAPAAGDDVKHALLGDAVAGACVDHVVARLAEERIAAGAAENGVVALAAPDLVVVRTGVDRVVATVAEEDVVASIAQDDVGTASGEHRIAVFAGIAGVGGQPSQAVAILLRELGREGTVTVDDVAAVAGIERVAPQAAPELVVVEPTFEPVVAAGPDENVVAEAAHEQVVGAAAPELVVALAAEQPDGNGHIGGDPDDVVTSAAVADDLRDAAVDLREAAVLRAVVGTLLVAVGVGVGPILSGDADAIALADHVEDVVGPAGVEREGLARLGGRLLLEHLRGGLHGRHVVEVDQLDVDDVLLERDDRNADEQAQHADDRGRHTELGCHATRHVEHGQRRLGKVGRELLVVDAAIVVGIAELQAHVGDD